MDRVPSSVSRTPPDPKDFGGVPEYLGALRDYLRIRFDEEHRLLASRIDRTPFSKRVIRTVVSQGPGLPIPAFAHGAGIAPTMYSVVYQSGPGSIYPKNPQSIGDDRNAYFVSTALKGTVFKIAFDQVEPQARRSAGGHAKSGGGGPPPGSGGGGDGDGGGGGEEDPPPDTGGGGDGTDSGSGAPPHPVYIPSKTATLPYDPIIAASIFGDRPPPRPAHPWKSCCVALAGAPFGFPELDGDAVIEPEFLPGPGGGGPYVLLAPSLVAESTITPSVNIASLTVEGATSGTAALQEWYTQDGGPRVGYMERDGHLHVTKVTTTGIGGTGLDLGGQVAANAADPAVDSDLATRGYALSKVRETGGPTILDVTSIPDGKFFKRSGSTVVGASAGPGFNILNEPSNQAENTIHPNADFPPLTIEGYDATAVADLLQLYSYPPGSGGALKAKVGIDGKVTATKAVLTGLSGVALDLQSQRAVSAADPTSDSDLSTRGYALDHIREGGGTILTMGAVSSGQVLQRSGSSCVGYTPATYGEATSSTPGLMKTTGDLGSTGYSPTVVGIHESGGQALAISSISDGEVLVRSGTNVDGVAYGAAAATSKIPQAQASESYLEEDWIRRNRVANYRHIITTSLTGSWTKVRFHVLAIVDSIYSGSTGEITVSKTGRYRISCNVTIESTSGTAVTGATIRMEEDGGGGYALVTGTEVSCWVYPAASLATCGFSIIMDVTAGDKFKIMGLRYTGSNTIVVLSNGSLWNFEEIQGQAE